MRDGCQVLSVQILEAAPVRVAWLMVEVVLVLVASQHASASSCFILVSCILKLAIIDSGRSPLIVVVALVHPVPSGLVH
jgi:hypothetical protein